MAKKIKIEDYEKETFNKKIKRDKLKICSLIMNGILGVCLIIILVANESLYSNFTSKVKDESTVCGKRWVTVPLESYKDDLDSLLNGKTLLYVTEKLEFIDDNIVFKIEGFGNYYYSYDCMMDKVDGNFSYWAYNKDAAISEGLKADDC